MLAKAKQLQAPAAAEATEPEEGEAAAEAEAPTPMQPAEKLQVSTCHALRGGSTADEDACS